MLLADAAHLAILGKDSRNHSLDPFLFCNLDQVAAFGRRQDPPVPNHRDELHVRLTTRPPTDILYLRRAGPFGDPLGSTKPAEPPVISVSTPTETSTAAAPMLREGRNDVVLL